MILSLFVVGGALAFLAWLMFTLAVFALPCFVGVSTGMLAYGLGAGSLGAAAIGFVTAVLTFAVGQAVLVGIRSPLARLLALAVFAVPAGLAGFGIVRDIARLSGANDAWAIALGAVGAAVTMAAALARLLAGPGEAGLSTAADAKPLVALPR